MYTRYTRYLPRSKKPLEKVFSANRIGFHVSWNENPDRVLDLGFGKLWLSASESWDPNENQGL